MRLLPSLLGFVLLLPATTLAGDYADSLVLGFSENGDYFAFEEYGVEDGSGFPYSNVYVIDTRNDSWLDGTPIRVRRDDEQALLSDVRNEALGQAYPVLTAHGISAPGRIVASNPATETSADPLSVRFLPRIIVPPGGDEMRLDLEQYPLNAGASCPDMGQPFQGYRLLLTLEGQPPRQLHRDQSIPGSRGCPFGYAISQVVTYHPPQGDMALVALIDLFNVGFEGPDRRFLAVATRLPQ